MMRCSCLSSNQRIKTCFLSIFLVVVLTSHHAPMALSSPFFIIRFDEKKKSLKILSTSRSAAGDPNNIKRSHVCSWRCCLVFSLFFFFVSFSAASNTPVLLFSTTTTTGIVVVAPPPTSAPHIKTTLPFTLFTITPTPSLEQGSSNHTNNRLIVILSVSAAVSLILMGFFTFLVRRRRRSKRVEDAELPPTPPPPTNSDRRLLSSSEKKKINHLLPPPPTSIKRFSWEEIVKMSLNFSTLIDQGGFSMVYLAFFSDSSRGALKIHPQTDRLDRIFKQELDILLHIRHPNIVQLLGYSDEQGDEMGGALVFEYVPNGNLREKLHGNGNGNGLVPWKSRMWIAFQLARAIEYLHDKCSLPIVHGDVKAANILLDDQLNCKLCDFGSATRGFSAMVHPSSPRRSLVGSPGYTDPHYMRTGIASKKNDVYSFGVIILELITGIEAFCPAKGQILATIAGPLLRGDEVDPRPLMTWAKPEDLKHSDSEEVMAMAFLSALCLNQQPSLRPSMADILTTMTNKISSITSFLAADSHHQQQQYNSMCN